MNKLIKKISKAQVQSQVYDQCKEFIIDGVWKTGDKLPSENQLCELFDVSRVSVRSAIQSLQAQGFIEIKRGEGSFVRNFSISDTLDILVPVLSLSENDISSVLEFRVMFEPALIPYAIDNVTDEDIDKLEEIYDEMSKKASDLDKYAELDKDFHLYILKMSGNQVVFKICQVLMEVFRSAWRVVSNKLGASFGLICHRKIIDAIKAKDKELATICVYEHVKDIYIQFNNDVIKNESSGNSKK